MAEANVYSIATRLAIQVPNQKDAKLFKFNGEPFLINKVENYYNIGYFPYFGLTEPKFDIEWRDFLLICQQFSSTQFHQKSVNSQYFTFIDNDFHFTVRLIPERMVFQLQTNYIPGTCKAFYDPKNRFYVIKRKTFIDLSFNEVEAIVTRTNRSVQSPHCVIGKYITHTQSKFKIPSIFIPQIKLQVLAYSGQKAYESKMLHYDDVKSIIENFPGFFYVKTIDYDIGGVKYIASDSAQVESIVHFLPNIKEIFKYAYANDKLHFQIDASFKLLSPYVFCLIVWMINHTPMIIGSICAPTECEKLYNLILINFQKIVNDIPEFNWESFKIKLYFQSDEGACLNAFFNHNFIKNCKCHIHIGRIIGINNMLFFFCRKILNTPSAEAWATNRPKIIEEMIAFFGEKKVNLQSCKKLTKIEKLLAGKFSQNGNTYSFNDVENDYLKEWALWLRNGMPPWTQSIEGLHHILKTFSDFPYHPNQTFERRYHDFLHHVFTLAINFQERFHDCFKRRVQKIESACSKYQANQNCKCPSSTLFEQQFGVPGCVHIFKYYKENELSIDNPPFNMDEIKDCILDSSILNDQTAIKSIIVEKGQKDSPWITNKEERSKRALADDNLNKFFDDKPLIIQILVQTLIEPVMKTIYGPTIKFVARLISKLQKNLSLFQRLKFYSDENLQKYLQINQDHQTYSSYFNQDEINSKIQELLQTLSKDSSNFKLKGDNLFIYEMVKRFTIKKGSTVKQSVLSKSRNRIIERLYKDDDEIDEKYSEEECFNEEKIDSIHDSIVNSLLL